MQFRAPHHRLLHQRRFRKILFGSVIITVIIAFLIVPIELTSENAKITSFSDGLWWAVQTATTVGYGDVTPVTEMGRFLGIIMLILGTVMFGTIIAMISSTMSRGQEEFFWNRLFERLDGMEERIEKIEQEISFLVKSDVDKESKK